MSSSSLVIVTDRKKAIRSTGSSRDKTPSKRLKRTREDSTYTRLAKVDTNRSLSYRQHHQGATKCETHHLIQFYVLTIIRRRSADIQVFAEHGSNATTWIRKAIKATHEVDMSSGAKDLFRYFEVDACDMTHRQVLESICHELMINFKKQPSQKSITDGTADKSQQNDNNHDADHEDSLIGQIRDYFIKTQRNYVLLINHLHNDGQFSQLTSTKSNLVLIRNHFVTHIANDLQPVYGPRYNRILFRRM